MPLDTAAPATVLHANDTDFDAQVLGADVPVLVDFWAPWCGPCRAIAPHLDAIASRVAGTAKIVKVNVDESPAVAAKYGIRSIPNLMVFKDGAVADQLVGNPGAAGPIEQLLTRHTA